MKKFYSALALAAACLSAQAADIKPAATLVRETASEVSAMETTNAPQKAAPQKAPASNMSELQGLYTGTYYMPLKGYDGLQTNSFAIVPTGENKVDVYGIADAGVPATVDFSKGTIELPGSFSLGVQKFKEGDFEVVLTHKHWNDNGEGMYDASNTPVIWNIVEGGIQAADEYDVYMLPLIGKEGSYMLGGGYKFNLTKNPENNPEQWYTTGEASFVDDGWFCPMFSWQDYFKLPGVPTLTCQFQRSSADENLVALYDPYGGLNDFIHSLGGQYVEDDIIEGNLPGRIVMNITNKQCVLVPNTYTGAICDGLWYGANNEALSAQDMLDADETMTVAEAAEAVLGFLGAENTSNYDEQSKIITIKNAVFTALGRRNESFADLDLGSGVVTIMLPEVESAIKNITVDENAPVEYYNLQGIRVENPAKGLYIKRQGNTATKVIL